MATPWTSSIKASGQLSVYSSSLTGNWAVVFGQALRDFNTLSRRHGLGVTLSPSSDPPTGSGGANVSVATGNGSVSCSYGGEAVSDSLDGTRMHGSTFLFSRGGAIEKAFIFLPSNPQVNTPRGVRAVGVNVMKLIAAHELVHACGLSNAEHSTDDLFQGSPQVDPGTTPAGDRVRIEARGRMSWMPPLVLSGPTVGHIQRLWSR